ncbi:MAG: N-acetylmuramoyl-L-alanine amidase [Deinococcales bacterium]
MARFFLCVLCFFASPTVWAASLEPPRVGSYAGYTRLVFDLPSNSDYRLEPLGAALRLTIFGNSVVAKSVRLGKPEVSGYTLENGSGNVVVSIATPQGVSSRRGVRVGRLAAMPGKSGFRLVLDFSGAFADISPLPNVAAPKTKVPQASIVLDPGHGGDDLGALGNGLREAELNLQVSFRIKKWLEQAGVSVELTRTSSSTFSSNKRSDLEARVERTKGKTAFISVHANAIERRSWNSTYGMEVFYFDWVKRSPWMVAASPEPKAAASEPIDILETPAPEEPPIPITNYALAPSTTETPITPEQNGFGTWQPISEETQNPSQTLTAASALASLLSTPDRQSASKDLAARVLANMLGATGASSRGVQVADFYVIKNAQCPAILLEMGFVTHPVEAEQLKNSNYLERIAYGVAVGILEYLDGLAASLELGTEPK